MIVKPESKGTGQPYIQIYANSKDAITRKPLVSAATVFVSQAWRYSFYEVMVDVMEQYTGGFADTDFWFNLYTNDQNYMSTRDFEWFGSTFRNSLRDIGQVLLVLSPWDDPTPLRRAWCLFEIFNSIVDDDVELSINLPSSEVNKLKSAVTDDCDCLIQALSDIQAENADAFVSADKAMIFEVIRKSTGGFAHVNEKF